MPIECQNAESEELPADANTTDQELTTEELLSHVEFGFWTAVVLVPILYHINGPSVSRDQFVVRCILAAVVYAGAPLMRLIRWHRARK